MSSIGPMIELFTQELQLCNVREGEKVAILSQGDTRADYADAFLAAATRLGAIAYQVRLADPTNSVDGDVGAWTVGQTVLAGNQGAIDALKHADLVIDLIFLLFAREQFEIQESGTRMLTCVEPFEQLAKMFPTRDQRERVEVGEELIRRASTLRFTSEHGTDVTYRLGAYPVMTVYGFTDEPGRWDHWPTGFVLTGGADDGVDGKVVIAPGDILLPFKTYVQTSIELTIEAGRILDIRGQVDADLLKAYMESFEDEEAYGISHIGWGLNEKAKWAALATDTRGMGMESRAFYGNVLFSTGPNGELGGSNETACHIDVPMRDCSLFLDDEPIVVDGDIVVPEMQAKLPA
jgi:2,5-dihydroxypyridine 5,6-dioxygenase